jgi:hypothetical protein
MTRSKGCFALLFKLIELVGPAAGTPAVYPLLTMATAVTATRHTLSSFILGNTEFINHCEQQSGMRLRKQKPGPKRKQASLDSEPAVLYDVA